MKRLERRCAGIGFSVTLLMASVWAITGPSADAQTNTQTAGAPTAGDQLAEVTVTAERVAESAERTPVSIVTYTPDEILREGVRDVQTLAETDPSLQFTTEGGHGALTLRGVSTSNTTEVGNPSVPLVIDDFTVNRADALDDAVFDLAQIEVLRGPQGTLFGRSASGGLVIMTTAAPTMQNQSSTSLEFGNYGTLNADAMINLPMSDTLQLRAALTAHRHQPYRLDTSLDAGYPVPPAEPGKIPNGGDDQDVKAGRIEMAFEPGAAFHGLLIYQYEDMNQAGPAIEAITFQSIDPTNINTDILHTRPPTLGDGHAFPMYGPQWWKTQDTTAKLHLFYDLPGNLTLSYLGGVDHYSHNEMASGDAPWPPAFYTFTPPGLGPYTVNTFFQSAHPTTQNDELRINSAANSRLSFQAGLYYFLETTALADQNYANAGSILSSTNIAFNYWVHTESRAAYGQAAFSVTPTSKVSAGARYSHDDVQRAGYVSVPSPGPFQVNETSSSKATWHLGYDWTPTATNLAYLKADSGYKPGGFSNCGGVQVNFLPETVTAYELGTKNQLADNHLQVNADGFYQQYTNQQVGLQGAPGCLHNIEVTNAGKSLIYGLEGDFVGIAPSVGRADLALSYLHARYQTFLTPPEIGAPALGETNNPVPDCKPSAFGAVGGVAVNCDLQGNVLPQAPTITVVLGLEHTWTMSAASSLTFRVEGHYSSEQWLTPFNFQDEMQPAYTVANAFVTYTHKNWQVVLWARNFTNASYLNYASENGGGWDYLYSWGDPRTYGIRIQSTLTGAD